MALVINGDGNVTGLTAGGLPDASITQADLAAGVAGNGPAFSAYNSGTQTPSHYIITKLIANAEDFDTASCFDTTLYRFTPNVAGYYQINYSVYSQAKQSHSYAWSFFLYKNGSIYLRNENQLTSAQAYGDIYNTGNFLVYCNGSTDYLELYGVYYDYTDNSTAQLNLKHFSGFLARAA